MFTAMNRFKVIQEECKAFKDAWLARDSRLGEVKGFVAFHLLPLAAWPGTRGPRALFLPHEIGSSHTKSATQGDFSAWTKSGQVRPPKSYRRSKICFRLDALDPR